MPGERNRLRLALIRIFFVKSPKLKSTIIYEMNKLEKCQSEWFRIINMNTVSDETTNFVSKK